MPTQWQDRYIDLPYINQGNELQNGDTILPDHVNLALENCAYTKKIADNNTNDISALGTRTTNLEGRTTTLEGKVSTLEGIHLYRHDVTFEGSGYYGDDNQPASVKAHFTIYTASSEALDSLNDIRNWITYRGAEICASGYVHDDNSSRNYPIVNATIVYSPANDIGFDFIRMSSYGSMSIQSISFTGGTYTDRVANVF